MVSTLTPATTGLSFLVRAAPPSEVHAARRPASRASHTARFMASSPRKPEAGQQAHHRAPVRETGLKEIHAHKGRPPVPVWARPVAQTDKQQNETTCNQTQS